MATNGPPSPKRKRDAEPPPAAPTSLMSLGDDMLAEILSRLPCLPSLASAAFASPRLYTVASSSAVSNRILSRAPLLGYFVSVTGGAIPAFHRAVLRSDRHLAAIFRRSDFHLTDFEAYEWRLMDCRHGLLLLSGNRHLVVFDPVSRSRRRITHKSISSNSFHCLLPACSGEIDGGPTSFRVLSLEENRDRSVRAHIYSSRTGEWCSHSRAPRGITAPRSGDLQWPMHAGGLIYWRSRTGGPLTSFDVGSMEFSHIALPENLRLNPRSYAVGDTEDGTTCLVAISPLRVWFRRETDKSWKLQRKMDDSEWDLLSPYHSVEKVCNVTAGVVLVSMGRIHRGLHYVAFRLKNLSALQEGTTKIQLEADFFASGGWVHPYLVAWPRPCLKENAATMGQDEAGDSKRKKASLKDQEAGGSNKEKTSLKLRSRSW